MKSNEHLKLTFEHLVLQKEKNTIRSFVIKAMFHGLPSPKADSTADNNEIFHDCSSFLEN